MPTFPATVSVAGAVLDLTPELYLLNNQWNVGGNPPKATGSQSVTARAPWAWSTAFTWTRADNYQVSTYVAAVGPGRHCGFHADRPQAALALPVMGPHRVLTEGAFTMTPANAPTCRYNVSFDLWLHATPTPTASDKRIEIMIWPAYSQDYLGVGLPHTGPTLAGRKWKLYTASTRTPGVVDTLSFLLDEPNLSAFTFDLMDFLRWVATTRPEILPPTHYLTAVEFGTEIYRGSGVLDVSHYTVRVVDPTPSVPAADYAAALAARDQAVGDLIGERVVSADLRQRLDQIAALARP